MDKFFILVIGSLIAFLLMRYRKQMHDFTGDIRFAEEYLGMGGTYTFFVLLGILIFILSLMYSLGTLQSFLSGTVGRLF